MASLSLIIPFCKIKYQNTMHPIELPYFLIKTDTLSEKVNISTADIMQVQ